MQKAHGRVLLTGGACLHNGADQHFDDTSPNRIQAHAYHKARKMPGHQIRDKGQSRQSRCRKDMGRHNTGAVTNPVHEPG